MKQYLPARALPAMAALGAAGVATIVYASTPGSSRILPPCVVYAATGIYCPGCGSTRSLHALLHGRFVEAVHDNLLFVVFLPFAAALLMIWLTSPQRTPMRMTAKIPGISVGALITVVLFTAMRNIPAAPFDWLAPIPV